MPEPLTAHMDDDNNRSQHGPPPRHRAPQPRHAVPPRGLQASIHNPVAPLTPITPNNSLRVSNDEQHGSKARRAQDSDHHHHHHHHHARGSSELHHRTSASSDAPTTRSFVSSTSGADTIINISRDDSTNRAVGSGTTARSSLNGGVSGGGGVGSGKDEQPCRRNTRGSTRSNNSSLSIGPNPTYQARLEPTRVTNAQQQQKQKQPPQLFLLPHHASYPSPAPSGGTPTSPSSPLFDSQPASQALLGQFHELQRQVQALRARNMKLGAEVASLSAARAAREATIDGLRGQLRAKEGEQARLVERFCAEVSLRTDELGRVREKVSALEGEKQSLEGEKQALEGAKQALEGRVAELEVDLETERKRQDPPAAQRKQMPVIVDCSGPCSLSSPRPSTYRGSESPSESGRHGASSSPLVRSSSNNNSPSFCTPFSSQTRDESAAARLCTETPSPSVRVQWRQRHPSLDESQMTSPSFVEDELFALSDQLAVHYERYSKEYQAMTAQLAVLAEDKAQLEKDLIVAREQQLAVAGRNRELEAKLESQLSFVQCSMAPIPELPVLTYAKPGAVWFDRVTSSFKYWGLFEFISQPDVVTSPSDPARDAKRLRAAVLLKQAIEDDILEDVIYLRPQRSINSGGGGGSSSTTSSPHATQTTECESPYLLFRTISMLKRTVPTSSMDLKWLDRISDTDFEDIEGFASLVLCLDRRHSKLYGTSVEHYEALVPKIQENISRRFPDLEKPLADLAPTPKKWWHLSLWMSRIVKRRQGRIAGDD